MKNAKILFRHIQKSSFSIIRNFSARRGSILEANCRSEMCYERRLHKALTLSAIYYTILALGFHYSRKCQCKIQKRKFWREDSGKVEFQADLIPYGVLSQLPSRYPG